ncbi:MAG: glycosyltransferase family 1 protein [Lachnospiraceae bacterium]|nr:glycosyltransferase family 1 protein [Lachnospiraceae bacterium]
MRVLHIFTNPHINNGATIFELRVGERLKDSNIYFDYLCTEKADKEELAEYKKTKSRVYRLPIDNDHGLFIRELKINRRYYHFFKTHDYDIVYADTENALRAIHLFMARLAGVKVRVVHSHNTGLQTESKSSRLISRALRRLFLFSATDYLACSEEAAKWLFPKSIVKHKKYEIIKNGIELEEYLYSEDKRKKMRKALGISEGSLVVGNVGRLMPQKNHSFMLDVFAELKKKRDDAVLLLVGEGKLRNEIEEKAAGLGISDSVIMTGNVTNVSDHLQAMDVFIMPSLFEGFGIAGIEAQAAGLFCLFSDSIPRDIDITPLAKFMPPEAGADKWAESILSIKCEERQDHSAEIEKAGFSIEATIDRLKNIYAGLEKRSKGSS